MAQKSWKFTVEPSEAGLRLDQLLSEHSGLSRRRVREALKLGGVQAEGRRIRVASRTLKPGTLVRLAIDDSLGPLPDLDLEVLHEDAWLLAVNKPAGMASQGTQASDRHDLMALLGRQRPGEALHLQHRLDAGTSGVILLAKAGAGDLGRAFQERRVHKSYLARTATTAAACTVEAPVGRLRNTNPVRWGCAGDLMEPRPALTVLRPATEEETAGLVPGHWVVAAPETGRTHQIRVHLASLGAPILGDTLYGGAPDAQLWLHAWILELEHPVTGEALRLVAPPRRFRAPGA